MKGFSKRLNYFLGHLLISAVLAVCITLLVTQVWYPAPLFSASGLAKVFFLLLLIDVIVGPVFSLLVYKENKKTLKFDLAVIALIQACALCYGLYTVAEGRPAWIVFNKDRFELVRTNEVDERRQDEALAEYQSAPWVGPRWVKVDLSGRPTDEANQFLLEEGLTGGAYSIAQSPVLYQPLNAGSSELLARKNDLNNLRQYNYAHELESVLQQYPQADGFLPLKSSQNDMVVLLNSKNEQNKIIGIVDLRPW